MNSSLILVASKGNLIFERQSSVDSDFGPESEASVNKHLYKVNARCRKTSTSKSDKELFPRLITTPIKKCPDLPPRSPLHLSNTMAFDTASTNVIEQLSIIDPVQPGTITNPMVAGSALIKNEARPETAQSKPQFQAERPKRFEYIELINVTVDIKPEHTLLTNHHFYRIHRSIHRSVPLNGWVLLPPNRDYGVHLFTLLGQWAGCRLVVDKTCRKLVRLRLYGMQCLDYCTAADEIIKGSVVRRMEMAKAEREASRFYDLGVWRECEVNADRELEMVPLLSNNGRFRGRSRTMTR
jgi:hypothetical protein